VKSVRRRTPKLQRQGVLRETVVSRIPGDNPRALLLRVLTRGSWIALLSLAMLPREATTRRVQVAVVRARPLVAGWVYRPKTPMPTHVSRRKRGVSTVTIESATLAAASKAACPSHTPSSIPSDHERRTAWGWLASFEDSFAALEAIPTSPQQHLQRPV
jgi:hypothetical protein